MRVPPCEKGHVISLVGTLASIVVLIVTLYTVWYPYLQTSAFIPAQCIPYKLEIYGPTSCQSSNSESCTTVPTSSLVTEFYNYTTWSTTTSSTTTTTSSTDSSNATVTSSVSTSTTPQTTINPQFPSITIPQNGYCPWFPCVQLNVIFSTTYGVGVVAFGKLYTDYDQMLDYPTCSYSACGSNNTANFQSTYSWLNYTSSSQFSCYANLLVTPHPVLTNVYFSYDAAVNSIFWPILSLVIFGTCLIVLRCFAWYSICSPTVNRTETRNHQTTVNYTNAEPPPPFEVQLPPTYLDSVNIGAINTEFPSVDEKNPANPAQWMVMYPPSFDYEQDYGASAAGMGACAGSTTMSSSYPNGATVDTKTSPENGWTSDGNDLPRY